MESKVTVKIFGQEYTIAGDKAAEEIEKNSRICRQ